MLYTPTISPHQDITIWLRQGDSPTSSTDLFDPANTPSTNHKARETQSRATSIYAQLAADRRAIEQRKQNVRRFGAGWLRPPGIAKTYQATMDELAEREEQEALARRDFQMQELANAQEAEARRQQALEAGEDLDGAVDGEDGGRNLDDDIPEADDGTFNGESLLEESQLEGQSLDMDADLDAELDVERMLEMEEAEMSGMLDEDRDLDDDVPEAGSYQHTDTEVEDESSEIDQTEEDSVLQARAGAARQSVASNEEAQLNSSSFLSSSPAARRGLARGNAFRERLMHNQQP